MQTMIAEKHQSWHAVDWALSPTPTPGTSSCGWWRRVHRAGCPPTFCCFSNIRRCSPWPARGRENLLVSEAWLGRSGIAVVQIERGGNITYHGPGQLVVYPIVHLPSLGLGVVDLVDRLEDVMIRTCAARGSPPAATH